MDAMKVQATAAAVCAAGIIFMLRSACAGLPLPNTPEESLIIFSYNIDPTWQQGNIHVKSIDIKLENRDTKEQRTISLIPGGKFKAVTLDPGPYVIKGLVVANQWQNNAGNIWFDTHYHYDSLYLNPRTIYLYRKMVRFQAQKERDGYNIYHFGIADKEKEAIQNTLQEDRHWLAWRDYTLYGF